MPNYETKLEILEGKGIRYHRDYADFIISKLNDYNPDVVLILGDNDFIISYLIYRGMKNRNCFLKVVADEEHFQPMTVFHMITHKEIGNFEDYDLIISIHTKRYEISEFSRSRNFILFPTIERLHESMQDFKYSVESRFHQKNFEIKDFPDAFPSEFNIAFYSK